MVPRDPSANLAFRRSLLQECRSEYTRDAIRHACSQDFLFWLNTYGWIFEPRGPFNLPFCTWPFQDKAFQLIFGSLGVTDVGMDKSRDMGATWMVLSVMAWLFQFVPNATLGAMSRYEDAVVAAKNQKSLFWKLDFLFKHQPSWLRPNYIINTTNGTIFSPTNGSAISGSSTTKDSARGDRYLLFFMDEAASFETQQGYDAWASTQATTNTRIAISTPKGLTGVFHDVMKGDKAQGVRRMSLHWTDHPLKRRGLYTSERGRIRIIDRDYKFPPKYHFVLDGKTRSPWYDKEESRSPSRRHFAQEVEIDYGGAGSPFFDLNIIREHKQKYGRPPMHRFVLETDDIRHELQLTPHQQGHFLTWFPSVTGEPQHDSDYGIGCDVATGRGGEMSTNSVMTIVNFRTGEKVAEFASNTIAPDDFAHLAIAMRKHFYGPTGEAFLIWEANGPGGIFGQVVMKCSPSRIFYRRRESTVAKKRTNEPGWWSKGATKVELLAAYQQALRRAKFVNPHASALEECVHYIYSTNGTIVHDRSEVSDDPSVAKENHGDRVIADALACKLLLDRPAAQIPLFNPENQPLPTALTTFGGRYRRWLQEQAAKDNDGW